MTPILNKSWSTPSLTVFCCFSWFRWLRALSVSVMHGASFEPATRREARVRTKGNQNKKRGGRVSTSQGKARGRCPRPRASRGGVELSSASTSTGAGHSVRPRSPWTARRASTQTSTHPPAPPPERSLSWTPVRRASRFWGSSSGARGARPARSGLLWASRWRGSPSRPRDTVPRTSPPASSPARASCLPSPRASSFLACSRLDRSIRSGDLF